MIEKEDLMYFLDKYCMLILENGFTYSGILKKINEESIVFDDRFQGIKLFDLSIIKSVGQAGEQHGRMG